MPVQRSVTERFWPTQIFGPISVDPVTGVVTVPTDTRYLKVNQDVEVRVAGQPVLQLTVREVLSESQLRLGPFESPFKADPSIPATLAAYAGGTMTIPQQERSPIKAEVITRALYEEEPTVAMRTVAVDWLGRFYATDNPLPVRLTDGSINIETLNAQVAVHIDARDNFPTAGDVHDSTRIGDGVNEMKVNPDGSINVALEANQNPLYDQLASSITSGAMTEIYSYTSSSDQTRVKVVESDVSTASVVQVLIDGLVVKERRTSPLERNAIFLFEEPRVVPSGKKLTVRAQVDRFIQPTYETFTSWEGYLTP